MREGAAAVAVPDRPDVRDVRPQSVVDHDVAVRVGLDTRGVEPEVVGVGPAADREQHVRADLFGFASRAIDANRDIGAPRREADAFRLQANYYALRFERFADRIRNGLVLARNQARHLLHHRDRGAETPENLGELEADIASSNDDEARG